MTPIGVGIAFLGYTVAIWGYCLIRGYDVRFTQTFAATWPGGGSSSGTATSGNAASSAAPTGAGQGSGTRNITNT